MLAFRHLPPFGCPIFLALSNYANDVVVDDYDYNDGINDDDDDKEYPAYQFIGEKGPKLLNRVLPHLGNARKKKRTNYGRSSLV